MDIAQIAQKRHSCKAFDPSRQLSAAQLQQLQDLLYWAPSSINSQPWHFFLASSAEAKVDVKNRLTVNGVRQPHKWDGSLLCQNLPKRLRVRNVAGDEVTVAL